MARGMNLGMPRIGPGRELKQAVEAYWEGAATAADLAEAARRRRADAWQTQAAAGIESIPSNDFSLYDQVLDHCTAVGAVPGRFGAVPGRFAAGQQADELDSYFAMARGRQTAAGPVRPLEMTKWFDTNYHYLVPELGPGTRLAADWAKPLGEHAEARRLGMDTRPVLIGPVSFLLLAKPAVAGWPPLRLLSRLLPAYQQVLAELSVSGCEWVQLDEPFLVTDLSQAARAAFADAYAALASGPRPRCLLATYFGELGDNLDLAAALPVDGCTWIWSAGRPSSARCWIDCRRARCCPPG
jgi:5-methyltetrahydropteroyltriglutamate--homocysteine methyltransferase